MKDEFWKANCFRREIEYIKDEKLKRFAEIAIMQTNDYFFEIPASSTGKYHPDYAFGTGGLVRHTKAAIAEATDDFILDYDEYRFTSREKDLLIISILLHDTWKLGDQKDNNKYTLFTHPLSASYELNKRFSGTDLIEKEDLTFICDCISTHMGQWTFDKHNNCEMLEKPKTKYQKFVHFCDYRASRKRWEINLDIPLAPREDKE